MTIQSDVTILLYSNEPRKLKEVIAEILKALKVYGKANISVSRIRQNQQFHNYQYKIWVSIPILRLPEVTST